MSRSLLLRDGGAGVAGRLLQAASRRRRNGRAEPQATQLRDAIQAPIDKAKARRRTKCRKAADEQRAAIDAARSRGELTSRLPACDATNARLSAGRSAAQAASLRTLSSWRASEPAEAVRQRLHRHAAGRRDRAFEEAQVGARPAATPWPAGRARSPNRAATRAPMRLPTKPVKNRSNGVAAFSM